MRMSASLPRQDREEKVPIRQAGRKRALAKSGVVIWMTSVQIVESSINGSNHSLLDKPPAAEGVLQLPTQDALHINTKGSLISTEGTLEVTALRTAPASGS